MAGQRDKKVKERPSSIFKDLGIMKARVEYNNDPWKIGRVKIRIPSLHGITGMSEFISTEDLPWATPCVPGGCGEDFGQFIAPVPGSFVWVFFEDNDTNKPVYIGGSPSKGGTVPKKMNNLTEEESPLQPWETEPGVPETATDVFNGKPTGVPERHVIYKSQKGHTILFDDTDGEENITILDRLGQIIKMRSPVSVEDNKSKIRRGLASAEDNTQIDKGQDPSILIRSGETDSKPIYTQYELFQDRIEMICKDSENDKSTYSKVTPTSFLHKTKDSELEMLEDSIRIEFPEIKSFYNEEGFYTEAFGDSWIKLFKDKVELLFKGFGFTIDEEKAVLSFKDSQITFSEGKVEISSKEEISLNSENVSSSSKNFDFEGEETGMKNEDGKLYLKGKEVHLN